MVMNEQTNKQPTDQVNLEQTPDLDQSNLLLNFSLAIHAVQGGAIAIQIVARLSCCLTDHSRTGSCVE